MGEDVLQTDQPHQDLLVGLLGKRVPDDVKLDDAPPLLQPGRLVAGSIRSQQVGLSTVTLHLSYSQVALLRLARRAHLWPQHGGGVRDGHHHLLNQLHRNVTHHADPLGILQGQGLGKFTLLP